MTPPRKPAASPPTVSPEARDAFYREQARLDRLVRLAGEDARIQREIEELRARRKGIATEIAKLSAAGGAL
jgi:seryl-tRNA synthetase